MPCLRHCLVNAVLVRVKCYFTSPVTRLYVRVPIRNELTRPFWCLIPLGRYGMHRVAIGQLDSPLGVDRTRGAGCGGRFIRTGNCSLP